MSTNPLTPILRAIRQRFGPSGDSPGALLLERFASAQDETAFAELVERYGPLVWGTCRRVAGEHAEDAFQATWLVLARKAGTIHDGGALPGWLHRVAFRLSLAARERPSHPLVETATRSLHPDEEAARQETLAVIDEEVERLPEKYRLPVLLCFLQERTHAEAAAELGWPIGTVAGRLARAKEILHARLTRRGVAPSVGLLPVAGAIPVVATEAGTRAAALALVFLSEGLRVRVLVWATLLAMPLMACLALLIPSPQPVSQPAAEEQPTPEPNPVPLAARIPHIRMTANNRPGSVSLSSDGKTLAKADTWIGIVNPPTGPGDIRGTKLWDLSTGKLLRTLIGGGNLACFSPDGKTLAAVSGALYVWDIKTGKLRFPSVGGYPNDWSFVCFSSDGKLIVSGQFLPTGNRVKLLETDTGNEVATLQGDVSRVTHLTISPDNRTVVAAGDDGMLSFWEVTTGKSLRTIRAHSARIVHVCFSPDGMSLVTASHDHTAKLWDGGTGKEKAILTGHTREVLFACFSPDGQTLATLSPTGRNCGMSARLLRRRTCPTRVSRGWRFAPMAKSWPPSAIAVV